MGGTRREWGTPTLLARWRWSHRELVGVVARAALGTGFQPCQGIKPVPLVQSPHEYMNSPHTRQRSDSARIAKASTPPPRTQKTPAPVFRFSSKEEHEKS